MEEIYEERQELQDTSAADNFCLCVLRNILERSAKGRPRHRIRQLQFELFQKHGNYIEVTSLEKHIRALEGSD